MKYILRVNKNDGAEIKEDELLITNMAPSIMRGSVQTNLYPLTSSVAEGCLVFTDTVEKNRKNVDVFGANFLAGAAFSNGNWTFSGIEGNIKSICFSYKDTAINYGKETLTSHLIDGVSTIIAYNGNCENCYAVDERNFYTVFCGGVYQDDVILRKYEAVLPYFGLNGWVVDKVKQSTSKLLSTVNIPAGTINTLWNEGNCGFTSDIETEHARSKSVNYYGSFNGHSMAGNKDKLFYINFFKYNVIDEGLYTHDTEGYHFASDVVVPCHSFLEVLEIDKFTMGYKKYRIDDFDGDSETTIKAGTYEDLQHFKNDGDIIRMQAGAADENYLYIISKIDYDSDTYKIYTLDISNLEEGTSFNYFADYDASIIHTINRKNHAYRSSWFSLNDEMLGLGVQDGICNFTGIFKGGMSAIGNIDMTITKSDKVVVDVHIEDDDYIIG